MNKLESEIAAAPEAKSKKPPLIARVIILIGAVFCFMAAAFAFQHNGRAAMACGFIAMIFYITGLIIAALSNKKASK